LVTSMPRSWIPARCSGLLGAGRAGAVLLGTHGRQDGRPRRALPGLWIVLFFGLALVIFFAGSARYLLPIVAPVAILVTRRLERRPALLAAGIAASLLVGVALASANYSIGTDTGALSRACAATWRRTAPGSTASGLRYYAEAEARCRSSGHADARGRPVITSELGAISAPGKHRASCFPSERSLPGCRSGSSASIRAPAIPRPPPACVPSTFRQNRSTGCAPNSSPGGADA